MERVYTILIVFIFLIIFTFWMVEKKENKMIWHEIDVLDQKYKSDSILLKNYQEALYEFINEDPGCAKKFIEIIEKKETQNN